MYRVVSIVDFTTFSYNLTRFLKTQTQIKKIFLDFEQSISLKNQNLFSPDFVIINLSNIHESLNDLRFLKTVYPDAFSVVITNDSQSHIVGKLIESGIKGVFHENDTVFFKDEFINLLNQVKNNGSYISQHFNHQMFEHIEKSSFENIKIKLTKSQDQIIDFLLRGDSYTDIAIKLNLSVNTVRKHITILYKKLKINNRASFFKIKMHNLIDVN
jgi:two-component system, NarL family, response regulator LiaR